MGIFEDVISRSNQPAPVGYDPYAASMEPTDDYSFEPGVPIKRLKRKELPEIAPPVPPLSQMAAQAGILAPGVGGLGNMTGAGADLGPLAPAPAAPPAPTAQPPIATADQPSPLDTAQWPAGPVGAPATPTDVSSRNKPGAPMQIAPQIAVPTAAPASPESPFALPSILDKIKTSLGNNSNTLLALGAGFAGAPNWGQGISRAAAAAIPARAADLKQSLATQTQGTSYQALVEQGVPKNMARAAIGDPAIMKSVLENYVGDRKGQLTDIGFDRYGNPIKGVFDPYTKKITPITMAAPTPASGGTSGGAGAGDGSGGSSAPAPNGATDVSSANRQPGSAGNTTAAAAVTADNDVTGPDFLEHLKETDPQYARQIEQIVNGDAPMPTGRLAATPYGKKIRQDVLSVEPGLSDTDFNTRAATRKSYTSGNDAKVTKSINTTLHHAQTLETAINNLDNFSLGAGILNPIRSAIEGQTSEKYQKAKGAYDTAVANFAKELDFAVSGGRPTVSGTKHQMEGFSLNASKAEQLEKLREGIDLLNGRLESHAEGYGRGMKKANPDPMTFVEPRNRKFYQHIMGTTPREDVAPEAAAPVAAAAPAIRPTINGPNGPMILSEDGKSWQPVK